MGAKKWWPEFNKILAGADVVICGDNDEPGREHVALVARNLRPVVKRLRVLDLASVWSEIEESQDISDWFAAGLDVGKLLALVDGLPDWTSPAKANGHDDAPGAETSKIRRRHFSGRKAKPEKAEPGAERAMAERGAPRRPGPRLANLANIMVALRTAPEIAGSFAFDEMMRAPILVQALPLADGIASDLGPYPRPVRDADVSQLQEWAQRAGLPRIGMDMTHQAVDLRAQECAFHPVRDYLERLAWDQDRAPRSMVVLLPRRRAIDLCRRHRPDVPDCDGGADHRAGVQVRLHARSGGRAGRRQVDGVWGSRRPMVFGQPARRGARQDVAQHVRGKWLIEVAELSATSRAEAEALKAFVSRPVERYRPSYGRKEVIEPRQCVFVGTTNKSTYLRDETGARRFWPVKVGSIDIEALRHDRDQLFAEAVSRYRAGEKWWPDAAFESEHIRPAQDDRFEADPWEEAIAAYAALLPRVRVIDVACDALFLEKAKVGTAEQRKISAVLIKLGWKSKRDEKGRWYVRPPVHDAHDAP